MSEVADRLALPCPSCSPEFERAHEVLKERGQMYTVRCTECGHVHKERVEAEETVDVDVVVSQDGDSFTATVEAPVDETVATGEEFILDTDEAIMTVRITSLELDGERRVEEAEAGDVETFWTRAVGNVGVNVTIHPRDGRNNETRSERVYVPGDYEFVVGETETFDNDEFTISGIAVRADAEGYYHDKLDHDGDTVIAKDAKRVYAWDEETTAWSAW
ncbi:HVO_0476 family zinc finger protein [Haloarchaeobius litoreus]|uniref:HVO_0476 family zinc finger protein n=1 Tax=Haloarchaeobius litoreus TaxID=755306 RepID=A0ABD6DFW8_9EURY|nr:HVO_0476 family zinc finger protein [Haloarchaeobius litoreus]